MSVDALPPLFRRMLPCCFNLSQQALSASSALADELPPRDIDPEGRIHQAREPLATEQTFYVSIGSTATAGLIYCKS